MRSFSEARETPVALVQEKTARVEPRLMLAFGDRGQIP